MSRRHRLMQLATGAVACGLMALSMPGQSPASAQHLAAGPTYTSSDGKGAPKFPNVDIVLTLTGANGAPIAPKPGDLKLTFQGKDAGTADSVRTFEQAGYGVTAILALDASGSMKGAPLNAIHASISKFVNQARPQDKVEVLTFADDVRVDVPFGADKASLTKELETVQARGHWTHLYDGLYEALHHYQDGFPKRRQLIVISDGHDEHSEKKIEEVIYQAKYMSVVIDSIGLTKDHGEYLQYLQRLSSETGGTFVRANSAHELEGLIDQGIQSTRSTPVATIKTAHLPTDGKNQTTQLHWQRGNLSAPAFIVTPKIAAGPSLWIWILGGCFLAGVILLALSWRGTRRKPALAAASTAGASQPFFAQEPPPLPPAPDFPGRDRDQGFRSPTIDDSASSYMPSTVDQSGMDRSGFDRPSSGRTSSDLTRSDQPGFDQPARIPTYPEPDRNAIHGSERGKTRLAVFWDAPPDGAFAQLRIDNGQLAGKMIAVTTPNFSIGAVEGNLLVLPGDATVSGQHARLVWENAVLKIEDNNSTNGTYVNGVRLAPGRHLLRPGDRIRIGQTLLVVDRG